MSPYHKPLAPSKDIKLAKDLYAHGGTKEAAFAKAALSKDQVGRPVEPCRCAGLPAIRVSLLRVSGRACRWAHPPYLTGAVGRAHQGEDCTGQAYQSAYCSPPPRLRHPAIRTRLRNNASEPACDSPLDFDARLRAAMVAQSRKPPTGPKHVHHRLTGREARRARATGLFSSYHLIISSPRSTCKAMADFAQAQVGTDRTEGPRNEGAGALRGCSAHGYYSSRALGGIPVSYCGLASPDSSCHRWPALLRV